MAGRVTRRHVLMNLCLVTLTVTATDRVTESHLVKIAQVISGSSCLLDGETKSKSAIEFRGKEIDD